MLPAHENRYRVLLSLNRLNELSESLSAQIVSSEDWLFLSANNCSQGVSACVEAASKCASEAKDTLKALEVQIKLTEQAMNRILRDD